MVFVSDGESAYRWMCMSKMVYWIDNWQSTEGTLLNPGQTRKLLYTFISLVDPSSILSVKICVRPCRALACGPVRAQPYRFKLFNLIPISLGLRSRPFTNARLSHRINVKPNHPNHILSTPSYTSTCTYNII